MTYKNVKKGEFIVRENRFVGEVLIDGKEEICHIKNTGRCKELLKKGAAVYLTESENSSRKTKYDLIAVEKGERLINIDSQAPNIAALEFLPKLFPEGKIYPERKYGESRFDFYIEEERKKIFLEVKGVTLEEDGIVKFPDAPTQRGVKHIKELEKALKDGYEAYILFVVQMKNVKYFTSNDETHHEFGKALREASENGVKIIGADCEVKPDSMKIQDFVNIVL